MVGRGMMETTENRNKKIDLLLGESRLWIILWLLSLLVIASTYLTPFFFELLSVKIFVRDSMGILDCAFSVERFWKSAVIPHCFFSGYVAAMLLDWNGNGRETKYRRWFQILGFSALFFFMLEVAQVFIPGRTISGGDILNHLIAYGVGMSIGIATLFCVSFANPSLRFAIKCVGCWFFVMIYFSIYPIALKHESDASLLEKFLASISKIPLKSDAIANFLLGWPIAWLLLDAWSETGSHHRNSLKLVFRFLGIALIVFSIGLFVETLQHLFAQRFPSIFDIVFQVSGAMFASFVYLFARIDRFSLLEGTFKYLACLDTRRLCLLIFVFGVLVFEWTPWIPSLEMSTIKEGLRELSLPFTSTGYPWDLHWQSDRIGVLLVFFCSALTGLAWHILLQPVGSESRIKWVLFLALSFFGFGIEFGKIFISTKYATPMLVLASFAGGLVICLGLVIRAGVLASEKFALRLNARGEGDV